MTRISKQEERRARSPRRHKAPAPKTGPKQDNLPQGYKPQQNAVESEGVFIGKISR